MNETSAVMLLGLCAVLLIFGGLVLISLSKKKNRKLIYQEPPPRSSKNFFDYFLGVVATIAFFVLGYTGLTHGFTVYIGIYMILSGGFALKRFFF